jgi:cysteine sulfinate desulfinase/cysteine desulfurase-like protein
MGVAEEIAHGSIRFSFARDTTDTEIDEALPVIAEVVRGIARTM